MQTVDLRLDSLREAPWNPNSMDLAMVDRLRESLSRYGLVENLVVRPMDDGAYEVLSGNHRFQVLKELGFETVPCAVVDLDDAHAQLLAQALNHLHGNDDLGLRAELIRGFAGGTGRGHSAGRPTRVGGLPPLTGIPWARRPWPVTSRHGKRPSRQAQAPPVPDHPSPAWGHRGGP